MRWLNALSINNGDYVQLQNIGSFVILSKCVLLIT